MICRCCCLKYRVGRWSKITTQPVAQFPWICQSSCLGERSRCNLCRGSTLRWIHLLLGPYWEMSRIFGWGEGNPSFPVCLGCRGCVRCRAFRRVWCGRSPRFSIAWSLSQTWSNCCCSPQSCFVWHVLTTSRLVSNRPTSFERCFVWFLMSIGISNIPALIWPDCFLSVKKACWLIQEAFVDSTDLDTY